MAWVVIPVVLAWLDSFVIQPMFLPRNLLMSVPPVALLLALGCHRPPAARALAVAALVAARGAAGGAAGRGQLRRLAGAVGQATAYVLAEAQPGDCIAFYPEDARMAFQYYVGTGPAASAGRRARSCRWRGGGGSIPYVEHYATLSPAQIAGGAGGVPADVVRLQPRGPDRMGRPPRWPTGRGS